ANRAERERRVDPLTPRPLLPCQEPPDLFELSSNTERHVESRGLSVIFSALVNPACDLALFGGGKIDRPAQRHTRPARPGSFWLGNLPQRALGVIARLDDWPGHHVTPCLQARVRTKVQIGEVRGNVAGGAM